MDNLQSYYAKEYARFFKASFPNMPCKPVPKSIDDLNFTEKTVLQEWEGGVLYQNMFRNAESLPADVLARHLDGGRYNVGDEVALRNAGFVADAIRVEGEIAAAKQQIRENELAAITARNAERDKRIEAYKNLDPMTKLAMHPPSAEEIARARAQWNITDRPSWEMDKDRQ